MSVRVEKVYENKGFRTTYATHNLPFIVVDTVVALTVKMMKYRFSYTF